MTPQKGGWGAIKANVIILLLTYFIWIPLDQNLCLLFQVDSEIR